MASDSKDLARVTILVPREVHKAWKREAIERGTTVSEMIRAAMAPVSKTKSQETA